MKLNEKALGFAGAIVSAATMLFLGIVGRFGFYSGAIAQMQQWHLFFSTSFIGIIFGMVEAAIISFVFLYVFAWTYNKFV